MSLESWANDSVNPTVSKKKSINPLRHSKAKPSMNIHLNHAINSDLDIVDISSPPPNAKFSAKSRSKLGFIVNPIPNCDCEACRAKDISVEFVETKFGFCSAKLRNLRKTNDKNSRAPMVPEQHPDDYGKITLVLDLDETLIHSRIAPASTIKAAQDRYTVQPNKNDSLLDHFEITLSDGETVKVFKRPGLDEFLSHVSEKYEVMAYTAGLRQYAEPLLNWLDPEKKIFRHRLYRDSCLFTSGYYVKDLHQLRRNIKRTILVDNNLCCFLPQLSNGIPISSFYDDPKDDALVVLRNFLEGLDEEEDVRHILSKSFALESSLYQTRDSLLK